MKTLQDFISAARILLQDTTGAPRYQDEEFKLALTLSFDEAYRIRPDMFVKLPETSYVGSPPETVVAVPRGYQSAFLYYMCGHVQLRDQEDTQDNRATIFLNKFTTQLLTAAS